MWSDMLCMIEMLSGMLGMLLCMIGIQVWNARYDRNVVWHVRNAVSYARNLWHLRNDRNLVQ